MVLHTRVEPNGNVHWGWIGKAVVGVILASSAAVSGGVVTYLLQNERKVAAVESLARSTKEMLMEHLRTDKPESGDHVTVVQFERYQGEVRDGMAKLITRDEMTATLQRLHSDIQQTRDLLLLMVSPEGISRNGKPGR